MLYPLWRSKRQGNFSFGDSLNLPYSAPAWFTPLESALGGRRLDCVERHYLLKNGLVKKIILHEVPTTIGEGIKPFDRDGILLIPMEGTPELAGVKVYEYSVA